MTCPPPETSFPFAPLEARAAALAPLADRLSLRDHVIAVDIGAFHAERGVDQRLRFDVVVELWPVHGAVEDDVDRILSYDRLGEAIAAELAVRRVDLLETLAEGIAARLLREPRVARVFVRIQKLDRGPGDLGVEIAREAREASAPADPATMPPMVVVTSPTAPDLIRQLEALRGEGALLICPGLPDTARPVAVEALAQRRIDLLALDQAAWALSARLGTPVVGTRTELDWALRRGGVMVWAPARIVWDAVDAPFTPTPAGVEALARWLAGLVSARGMIVLEPGMADAVRP